MKKLNLHNLKNNLQELITLKTNFFWASLFMLLCLFSPSSVSAQQNFKSFWRNFRTAVINRDTRTVAKLTRFPLENASESVVEGVAEEGEIVMYSRSKFLKNYNVFFGKKVKPCFQKPELHKVTKTRMSISCTGMNYYFERTKSGWKFSSFER